MITGIRKQRTGGGAVRTEQDRQADCDAMAVDLVRRNPGLSVPDAHAKLSAKDPATVTPTEGRRYEGLLAEQNLPDASDVAKSAPTAPTVGALAYARVAEITIRKHSLRSELDERFPACFSDVLMTNDEAKQMYGLMAHSGAELPVDAFIEQYGSTPIAKLRGAF